MDVFSRLHAIDRTRERLFIYETRLRRLFFARALRDRQLARIAKRWQTLTEERNHIMGLIAANPQLRAILHDRETRAAQKAVPLKTSGELATLAQTLAVAYGVERDAKAAFHDSAAFLKWRDRDAPAVPEHEARSVRDRLHRAFQMAQVERLTHQKTLEDALAALYDASQAILERERLMTAALRAYEAVRAASDPKPNAFAQWHHLRTGQWPRQNDKSQSVRSRQRAHGRHHSR